MLLFFVKECHIEIKGTIRPISYSSRPITWYKFCMRAINAVTQAMIYSVYRSKYFPTNVWKSDGVGEYGSHSKVSTIWGKES